MPIYDVFNGEELQGTVTVHADGRHTWEILTEWQEFWFTKEHQASVERALKRFGRSDTETLKTASGAVFTIRRRPDV